ncbi:MAG TPA: DUF305 domain-containing protein [Telluria sp.]|nr:DUF305 domain-containing protein [Telluria sp.]
MNRFILKIVALGALLVAAGAGAHDGHHHGMDWAAAPPAFVASTAKPFAALMDDAMAVMDYGMRHAPMNGAAEHDFVSMMLPHHQGAVDMAKALLLTTTDPALRNLAQGMIAEQQIEIQYMQLWLKNHPAAVTPPSKATP